MDLYYLYRHVAKTGDIKDFVITEESGIAKGIRRLVVVTGHEAQEVTRVAQVLLDKLASIDSWTGKPKDAALKALSVVRFRLSSHIPA
jgi:alanyl-tRNA synthetase